MPVAPTFFVNNPSSGVHYYATGGYQFVPNAGTSITVTVKAWTGLNGTGSLIACSTLIAQTFDVTLGSAEGSFSGSNDNTVQVISSKGTNGSDIFAAEGSFSGSQNVGSLSLDATYTGSPVLPSSITFSPSSGPVGTSVAISGHHFSGATSVKFNGTSASYTVNSDSSITATVPAGATSGTISVSNPSGTGTSAGSFTVTASSVVAYVNTGTPAAPVWTAATGNIFVNTGTPAAPVWTPATQVAANTGTPAAPVWTPGG